MRGKNLAVAWPAMMIARALSIAAVAVLLACNQAAPPTTTAAAPVAPANQPPAEDTPTRPGAKPDNPSSPSVPGGAGGSGGGSSPALPSVVGNIVFEINTGAASARSSSIASLPPIDGARQGAVIVSERIQKTFPEDFTYLQSTADSFWVHYPWRLKEEARAITQDWLNEGGTVIPSYSLNGGTEWLSGTIPGLTTVHRWGYNESGGYVKIEMRTERIGSFVGDGHSYHVHNSYACTTTETSHSTRWHDESVTPPLPHHPTMAITEGAATATAEATLANGVITAVGNIQHGSGTFTGTNIAYTWGTFWGEPQRGSGATFTFTVSGGQVTAVNVTNGGTGYRKPCNAGTSYTSPPSYYVDKTEPGYWETASMRAALRRHGTEPLFIRFAIISP